MTNRVRPDRQSQLSGMASLWADFRKTLPGRGEPARLWFIRHRTTGRLAAGLDRRALSWPTREEARAFLDAQRPERVDGGSATWADMHELASVIVRGKGVEGGVG